MKLSKSDIEKLSIANDEQDLNILLDMTTQMFLSTLEQVVSQSPNVGPNSLHNCIKLELKDKEIHVIEKPGTIQ